MTSWTLTASGGVLLARKRNPNRHCGESLGLRVGPAKPARVVQEYLDLRLHPESIELILDKAINGRTVGQHNSHHYPLLLVFIAIHSLAIFRDAFGFVTPPHVSLALTSIVFTDER